MPARAKPFLAAVVACSVFSIAGTVDAAAPEQVYQKHTIIDFGDDTIEGEIAAPDGMRLWSFLREIPVLGVALPEKADLDDEAAKAQKSLAAASDCASAKEPGLRLAAIALAKSKLAFFAAEEPSAAPAQREQGKVKAASATEEAVRTLEQLTGRCSAPADRAHLESILFGLGVVLADVDPPNARPPLERFAQEYPQSVWLPKASLLLGDGLFASRELAAALVAYERAARAPEPVVAATAVYMSGWCFLNQGDWRAAMARFERAAAATSDALSASAPAGERSLAALRKEALRDYVRAFAHVGDPRKAHASFRLLAGEADVEWMLELLAADLSEGDAHADAIAVLLQLERRNPMSMRLAVWQARMLEASAVLGWGVEVEAQLLVTYLQLVRERLARGDPGKSAEIGRRDAAEGEALAELTLRAIALRQHKDGKRVRGAAQQQAFARANELYADYLTLFPKPRAGDAKASDEINLPLFIRFYRAEVLFALERFAEAADEYELVAAMNTQATDPNLGVLSRGSTGSMTQPRFTPIERTGEPTVSQVGGLKRLQEQALEGAVHARYELCDALERRRPPPPLGSAPAPLPEAQQALIEAYKRYLEYVDPTSDESVRVHYAMAHTYFRFSHFEQAMSFLNALVAAKLGGETCQAALLILAIHEVKKDDQAVADAARDFAAAQRDLGCSADESADIAKARLGALARLANAKEKAGAVDAAATLWQEVAADSLADPSALLVARLALGNFALGRNDNAAAAEQLEAAVRLAPDSAEAQSGLTKAYAGLGKPAGAAAAFVKSVLAAKKAAEKAAAKEAAKKQQAVIDVATPVILGSLSPELVKGVVDNNRGQVRTCYDMELQKRPTLNGRLLVKWVIGASGDVLTVKVAESTLKPPETGQCVVERIRTWRFPAPAGGGIVEVSYPFVLKPAM